MAYATAQDIIDRYGEDALFVAADRNNDDAIDNAAVERALDDATDEINTYIGKRYTLPIATVPRVVMRLCVDITLYRLSPGMALTEEKRQRYEDAIALLKLIAKGEVSLGLDDGSSAESAVGDAEVISNERQFSRRTMRGLV